MAANLNESMEAMRKAQVDGSEALAKAFTQGTGLVAYDLQAPAIALYPFMAAMTMLRNEIPRVGGGGDTATRWKAITGINTANAHPGVSEGNRGALVSTSVANYLASYAGFGLEDTVSFESDYAAQGFDDVKARARLGLLRSLMLAEEGQLLGGNASFALGTTPTPTLAAAGSGATLPALTYGVICVALTSQGWQRTSLANGVPGLLAKSNVDGSTDNINGGAAQKSAEATQAVTLGQSLNCYVTPVEGAVGYAWFIGAAGSEHLEFLTTINSLSVSAPLNGTRQLASALTATDYSRDTVYNIDGLLTFCKSPNNSIVQALATGTVGTGTSLTSDSAGGVQEINNLLQNMYDQYRLGPDEILVSSAGIRAINKLCISNGGSPLFRFVMDDKGGQSGLAAGATIGSYLNPITNQLIRVRVHPSMTAGTILGYAKEIPYPLNGVGNVMQVKTRREYYSIDWPVGIQGRKYAYGCYCDEVLQHFAPFAMFKLYNIAGA